MGEKIKTILFDFDGTIGDTFEVTVEIVKKIAIDLGYGEMIDKYDVNELRERRPRISFTSFVR